MSSISQRPQRKKTSKPSHPHLANFGAVSSNAAEEKTKVNEEDKAPKPKPQNTPPESDKPAEEGDSPGAADPDTRAGDDGGASGYGFPPQDIPVIPGQLLRFVLRPTDEEKAAARKKIHPQLRMNKFWKNFDPDYEGGVTQILPDSLLTKKDKESGSKKAVDDPVNSYHDAREQCMKRVKRIIRECRALNQKYTDIHFDIERDMKLYGQNYCLYGVSGPDEDEQTPRPQDVRRVTEIFDKPQFYKDGAGFDDIVQGIAEDCWFLAAISALTANQQLIENVCVMRDEEVGVYGFVFHRDGEWHPCIVDDKLYLKAPSFEESGEIILTSYSVQHQDQAKKYRETFQTGSKALFFAACRDENETWVPLMEKAYAKAHGDFASLDWGSTGEALEDLTGGVSTEVYAHNILNRDRFWFDKLSRAGKDYIFSCSTAPWLDSRTVDETEDLVREGRRQGVVTKHAYAVLDTYEGHGQRLVKIRNPWGQREWSGAWSDGSKEWTSEWVDRLKHNFGDDGVFWISYEDMLQRYTYLECTRMFGSEWHIKQQWAQVQVPWDIRDYQQTSFMIDVPATTEAVFVLSKLDSRYFRGFEGPYFFTLQFRLQKADETDEDEYIIRSKVNYTMHRSTNVEINLEPGKYVVLFKIQAWPTDADDIETVIRKNIFRRDKVVQIATLYDLACRKGQRPKRVAKKKELEVTGAPPQTVTAEKHIPEKSKDVAHDSTETKPVIEQPHNDQPMPEAKTQTEDENNKPHSGLQDKVGEDGNSKVVEEKNGGKVEVKSAEGSTKVTEKDTPKPAVEKATQSENERSTLPTTAPNQGEQPPAEESDDEDDPQRNPWNAFCTVGLRVYSKISDLTITVVDSDEEQSAVLDGEDIAKAPLSEAQAAPPVEDDKKEDK